MSERIFIHETAFLTSTLRSRNESLSGDPYAKLWNNPRIDRWVHHYLENSSYAEITSHGFRNRFFLEHIQELFASQQIEYLINFGAGFSMYPFLLNADLKHIEIDQPELIEYKKEKVQDWIKEGKLPEREISYIKVNFNTPYEEDLANKLTTLKGDKKCFILLEGVLFFLNLDIAHKLFNFFAQIQQQNDFVGSVSFQKKMLQIKAYQKLLDYMNAGVKKEEKEEFLLLDDEFYTENPHYQLLDHQDYFSLSEKYKEPLVYTEQEVLNENYYVLKRV